ncbi:putative permease protein [Renibacterium salmoninarum ATCC 33209]|uniref:Putative permease protein n=1 Tax=Renibacterium salmoninarum (strain ATCC 33209 / DSM 20767 / JCM 11484 / NBRC 15589 / NCIMB 2235) TaxID=288705 RepID=A9WMG3_RENSM|nr:hypothetical protein [Renibacterium salmoninarum]ABY23476.1 putative permease protein [Renibacterium salmoninarum ATCC 33209]
MSGSTRLRSLLQTGFKASPGVATLTACVVLLAVFMLTLWPRAVSNLISADIQQQIKNSPAALFYPTAVIPGVPLPTRFPSAPIPASSSTDLSADDAKNFAETDAQLAAFRDKQPEPLRSVLGQPQYTFTLGSRPLSLQKDAQPTTQELPRRVTGLSATLAFDPRLSPRIKIIEGRSPNAHTTSTPIEVMASQATAASIGWKIDREISTPAANSPAQLRFKLVGIFQPTDSEDPYWAVNHDAKYPLVDDRPDTGIKIGMQLYPATSLISTLFDATLPDGSKARPYFKALLWYPFQPGILNDGNTAQTVQQLRSFLNQQLTLGDSPPPETSQQSGGTRFVSNAIGVLNDSLQSGSSTNAILALLASAPLGLCLSALALCLALIVRRAESTLRISSARGASTWQLRKVLATEGALMALPAGALGAVGAIILFPAPTRWTDLVLPLIFSCAPAMILAALVPDNQVSLRGETRRRSARKWRLAAEALVIILAGVLTALLVGRGYSVTSSSGTSSDGATSVAKLDPLIAATPLFMSIAVAIILLRLLPIPLRALHHMSVRRTGFGN